MASAASVRTHGGVDYGIALPTTGNVGVECRNGGPQKVVVTYDKAIGGTPVVALSSGTLGAVTMAGTDLTINLSGVADGACVTVTIDGITCDTGGTAAATHSVKVLSLYGDVNANKLVNVNDVNLMKSKSNLAVDATTAKYDLNVNGIINVNDVNICKSRSNVTTPQTCTN